MSNDRITGAQARALREAATPGPWILTSPTEGGRVLATDPRATIIHVPPCSPFNDDARAVGTLIAAAPALALAVEELEAERDAANARADAAEGEVEAAYRAGWEDSERADCFDRMDDYLAPYMAALNPVEGE